MAHLFNKVDVALIWYLGSPKVYLKEQLKKMHAFVLRPQTKIGK